MPFPTGVVMGAWDRAGGKCERCGAQLIWENKGEEGPDSWKALYKTKFGGDALWNCEILCQNCLKSAS